MDVLANKYHASSETWFLQNRRLWQRRNEERAREVDNLIKVSSPNQTTYVQGACSIAFMARTVKANIKSSTIKNEQKGNIYISFFPSFPKNCCSEYDAFAQEGGRRVRDIFAPPTPNFFVWIFGSEKLMRHRNNGS